MFIERLYQKLCRLVQNTPLIIQNSKKPDNNRVKIWSDRWDCSRLGYFTLCKIKEWDSYHSEHYDYIDIRNRYHKWQPSLPWFSNQSIYSFTRYVGRVTPLETAWFGECDGTNDETEIWIDQSDCVHGWRGYGQFRFRSPSEETSFQIPKRTSRPCKYSFKCFSKPWDC